MILEISARNLVSVDSGPVVSQVIIALGAHGKYRSPTDRQESKMGDECRIGGADKIPLRTHT